MVRGEIARVEPYSVTDTTHTHTSHTQVMYIYASELLRAMSNVVENGMLWFLQLASLVCLRDVPPEMLGHFGSEIPTVKIAALTGGQVGNAGMSKDLTSDDTRADYAENEHKLYVRTGAAKALDKTDFSKIPYGTGNAPAAQSLLFEDNKDVRHGFCAAQPAGEMRRVVPAVCALPSTKGGRLAAQNS